MAKQVQMNSSSQSYWTFHAFCACTLQMFYLNSAMIKMYYTSSLKQCKDQINSHSVGDMNARQSKIPMSKSTWTAHPTTELTLRQVVQYATAS